MPLELWRTLCLFFVCAKSHQQATQLTALPRYVKYTRQPAPTCRRNSETSSPTGSTSPVNPRSNRLILATTTLRTVALARSSSNEVNSEIGGGFEIVLNGGIHRIRNCSGCASNKGGTARGCEAHLAKSLQPEATEATIEVTNW